MAKAPAKGEFERIAAYFAPLAKGYPGAFGLLDDAAVLALGANEDLVVTTDTIVAGVHFIGDEPADLIGRKLLRVNLSDLAAKGAAPLAYTLNIALPRTVDDIWLEAFSTGLRIDQEEFAIHLIGGDSVSTDGPITLTVTAFGVLDKGTAVRRSGARVGDGIYVSGTIGDATLGLAILRGRLKPEESIDAGHLIDRYRLPRPRIATGQRLHEVAHAAADVSDGLVADLGHIAETSGVAAVIEAAKVPLSTATAAAVDRHPDLLEAILTGGDDYELVFTAATAAEVERVAGETGLALTRIGRIEAGAGVVVLDAAGRTMALRATGFRHA